MFKKSELPDTMRRLYQRQCVLCEQMEWFDGGEGEREIDAEVSMINAVFEEFYKETGRHAVDYFKLDQEPENECDGSTAAVG